MDFCVNLVVLVELIKTVNRRGNCGSVVWILTVLPLENTRYSDIHLDENITRVQFHPE